MRRENSLLLLSSGIDSPNVLPSARERIEGYSSAVIVTTASREYKEKNKHAIVTQASLLALGLETVDYLDVEFEDASALLNYDVIFIGGGHPFYLMQHLIRSGADSVLREISAEGDAFIIGNSAGAVVLGPDLRIVSTFDPDLAEGYENLAGVGLFPFTVLPHANRWEERLPDLKDRLSNFSEDTGLYVERIRDGDGAYV
jgi:dipeptidase E